MKQAVRPVEDAWLVSASLGLLEGSCSDALKGLLGWQSPVPVNVAAVQLLALTSMHPQVGSCSCLHGHACPTLLKYSISEA